LISSRSKKYLLDRKFFGSTSRPTFLFVGVAVWASSELMGNQRSSDNFRQKPNPSRVFFVVYESSHKWSKSSGSNQNSSSPSSSSSSSSSDYDSHQYLLRYGRYQWRINKRFREIVDLDYQLYQEFPEKLELIKVPQKYPKFFRPHDENLLLLRGRDIGIYLQILVDDQVIFQSRILKEFLRIGQVNHDR
jgi:hypothetical protein